MSPARILIVEDNPLNMSLVCAVLERRGHQLVPAVDVPDALATLQGEPPDLVLLDIQVPGGGGEEVLRVIRADPRLAGLTVIAVTAFAMAGDRERFLGLGFDGYLSKPIDVRSFGVTVESFLDARRR